MLEDAADVPTGGLGQVCVGAFAEEQGLPAFPEALVDMHASAVVIEDWLGHKRCCLAVFASNVSDDVFVDHHVVCGLNQLSELHAKFMLAGTGHFMVVLLDRDAEFSH
ncbi:MAG: Uncharacterised protein [Prochlorococcus marinus str. MIT 9215]|nr:MAG: Uncharacterised protein [Prochlorococcus marinus str. MIT 9215]